jgi:hypothetical protein
MAQTTQLSITTSAWTQISGVTAGMLVNIEARFAFYAVYSNTTPAFSEGYLIEDDKDTASSICNFSDVSLGSLWVRSKNVNQTVFVTHKTISTTATITSITNPVTVIPAMSSAGHTSVQTAATGTNWTAFASQACKQLTISNQTGTTIEFRQGATGVGFQVPTGSFYTFFGLSNANSIDARRVDTSNTQVTVTARWES